MEQLKFLNEIDNKVYFTGNNMDIFIPDSYFKDGLANYIGDKVTTLGIFKFAVYHSENKDKPEVYTLSLPINTTFQFEDEKTSDIILGEKMKEKYHIFNIEKGMEFCESTMVDENASASKKFIFMINAGHINEKDVNYSDLIRLYLYNLSINNVGLENQAVMYELTLATLCRLETDTTIEFREALNSPSKYPNLTEHDYKMIPVTKIPALTSTFGGLMFEDIKESVISGILRTKSGQSDERSPLEDVIKY